MDPEDPFLNLDQDVWKVQFLQAAKGASSSSYLLQHMPTVPGVEQGGINFSEYFKVYNVQ